LAAAAFWGGAGAGRPAGAPAQADVRLSVELDLPTSSTRRHSRSLLRRIWAKWNAATEATLADLGLPSIVVRLEDLRGKRAASTLRRMAAVVLPGSVVDIKAAVAALSRDLGTHDKLGTGSLARTDAVAKWRSSKHRFDAMDSLSESALRKYGYPVPSQMTTAYRRRRKPP